MWTNLLWTYGFKQGLHVVIVSVNKWVRLSVVGVNITGLHVSDSLLVVALSVCLLVFGFDSE